MGGLIWGITLWYLIPMVVALPLLIMFAPATLPLVAFMLAPCAVLYAATDLAGSLNRWLRIQGLPQHDELREYLKGNCADPKRGVKYQWGQLQKCTNTEFQRDAMPCINLMRGFEADHAATPIHPEDKSNRRRSKIQPEVNVVRNLAGAGSIMQVLTREHPLNWQEVYANNSVSALLETVKLQVLKVIVFGGLALLAYANLAFTQFYRTPDWTSVLAQASSGIRWPDIPFMFDVSFQLPMLLMFDFRIEVRLFLYFGIALIFADELIKKFRVPFYAFNFRGYQRIYDFESMPADAQESELCRRLEGVERGTMYADILEAATEAGGEVGRRLLMKLLRPKVEEHLLKLRVKVVWQDIEPAMARIDSIAKLKKALQQTSALVGQAILNHKLEEVGVQPKHTAAVSAMLKDLAGDAAKTEAVFNATMPLVGGQVTMAKVEAVLDAVGVSKEQASAMLVDVAAPLVERKLEEVGVQPKHTAAVSAMLKDLAGDAAKTEAVFNATMPLVGGQVTMAKVEAVLNAVGVSKEQASAMLVDAAAPLVERKLEEVGVQPEEISIVKASLATLDDACLKSVFIASLPLVGGQVTMAKVGAVLEVLDLDQEQLQAISANVAALLVERQQQQQAEEQGGGASTRSPVKKKQKKKKKRSAAQLAKQKGKQRMPRSTGGVQ
jgi:hypothetical protein